MTLREEIEKAAQEYGFPNRIAPCHFNVIVDFVLAQVEKADRKAREECAEMVANAIRATIKGEK